ncbi:MAG: glycosyltransferase, partial [bacterium]
VLPRCWLALASGSCVLMEYIPILEKHLTVGDDLITFEGPGEAAERIVDLLDHTESAQSIMKNGWDRVQSEHQLKHRSQAILDEFNEM